MIQHNLIRFLLKPLAEMMQRFSEKTRERLFIAAGLAIFVMNFLSLQLSLGLASGYFVDSKVYDDAGTQIGGSRDWKAGTGLNLLDLNFGLTFYL